MRVYILENQHIQLQSQLVSWLYEKTNIQEIALFKNEKLFLEMAERKPPDVAFIRLSGGTMGVAVGERLQRIVNDTDIVFISDRKDLALEAYNIGASGYLMEPIQKDKFEGCFTNLHNIRKYTKYNLKQSGGKHEETKGYLIKANG